MSNKPSVEGVSGLRLALKQYRSLAVKVTDARAAAAAAKLDALDEELRRLHKRIIEMLDRMDCSANGNMGWESRITWMLLELVQQEESSEAHSES